MQLRSPLITSLFLASATLATACSSDDDKKPAVPEGGAGGGGSDASTCDVTLSPSDNDAETIQSALDSEVKTGDTVCFSPGTYRLDDHIVLGGASRVTFRGTGASRDDVLLDFSTQTSGKEGVLIQTDFFTIENLWIKNTKGNGIQVQADDSVFRNVKVGWDEPADANNNPLSGGYAIYPTGCKRTLIEDSEVYGASDAGIYAGQCEHVIARRNDSHGNVLGIEIENTTDADVYENKVHGNTTGFLLDLLPNLPKKDSKRYLVHDNDVYDNNLPNFAEKNTVAATAPAGTGVLVLAATEVEIKNNKIHDNEGVAVMIVSYDIIDIIAALNGQEPAAADPETPRWPEGIYVHGNTYTNNGTKPTGSLAILAQAGEGGTPTIDQHVLWDGILGPGHDSVPDARICLGSPESGSFLNFHGDTSNFDPKNFTTDTSEHDCTLTVPPLTP